MICLMMDLCWDFSDLKEVLCLHVTPGLGNPCKARICFGRKEYNITWQDTKAQHLYYTVCKKESRLVYWNTTKTFYFWVDLLGWFWVPQNLLEFAVFCTPNFALAPFWRALASSSFRKWPENESPVVASWKLHCSTYQRWLCYQKTSHPKIQPRTKEAMNCWRLRFERKRTLQKTRNEFSNFTQLQCSQQKHEAD